MPRYFFDFQRPRDQSRDDVGSELADDHAAQVEAVEAAAEWLKDNASVAGTELTVLVRNADKPLSAVTASILVTSHQVSLEGISAVNGVAAPLLTSNPARRSVE